ncbi:ACT domain-containing protein [Pseudoteredinibacter isoporae]|uniref:ACT domain-containing protein n=1 Tax=Pseudoteredinibacter isoporae TaxID=570281 RepID=UPI00310C579B
MTGEAQLSVLLSSMEPKLQTGRWVFTTIATEKLPSVLDKIPAKELQSLYQEAEGCSLILSEAQAEYLDLDASDAFAAISLSIHSSLEAVGLTAAISTALAKEGISANVVAAYFHDHIYVPIDKAEAAMACLAGLGQG